jgi:hypothetical protein
LILFENNRLSPGKFHVDDEGRLDDGDPVTGIHVVVVTNCF